MLSNVKYEYENTKSGFKFTFYRPLGQKYVQDKMTKTAIIKKNNYIRIAEIARVISKDEIANSNDMLMYYSKENIDKYGVLGIEITLK